nr:hypothetical protein [Tanacetum cinerariifolium]
MDFGNFVRNFNMHCVGKTMTELHALLIDYEKCLKDKAPTPQVLTIQKGWENKTKPQAKKKDKSKGKTDKNKKVVPYQPKPKHNPLKRKENPIKDQTYHHCHVARHWKRNCPIYLEELQKNKDKAKHGAAASEVELQLGKKIKALRSDRGGKYLSQEFKDYLNMVRSMFNLTTLPLSFWDYALESTVRILNMVPTKKVDKTPYEIWHSKTPNLSTYMKRDSADKLHQRSLKCIFVGHPKETMGYYFYFPPENKVIVASAMDEEMNSIKVMKVWIVVGLPANAKVVRSKWLYKKKTDMDDEDIYMEQPEGYVDLKYPNRVCKLQRSIYGLKQASRWNKRFDEEIKKFGFIQNCNELCVYRKASESDGVFLILYVVDLLIIGNNISRLKEVNDYLGKCFSMKDLVEAAYILGIKIYKDRSRRNELCTSTPEEVAYMKKVHYASAVGSIMKLDTELDVTGFCDASWQCDKDDMKSQTGYVFVVNGGAVDWKSKKYTTSAMHSTQDEYVAASEAAMEAVWIRKFVGDLGVMPSINKSINMYCDNSAAIIFANEPGIMKGVRNFLRRYHHIREQVETGEIKLIKFTQMITQLILSLSFA